MTPNEIVDELESALHERRRLRGLGRDESAQQAIIDAAPAKIQALIDAAAIRKQDLQVEGMSEIELGRAKDMRDSLMRMRHVCFAERVGDMLREIRRLRAAQRSTPIYDALIRERDALRRRLAEVEPRLQRLDAACVRSAMPERARVTG